MSDERSEPVVDLAYIGRARLTAKVAGLHDDMHVLTAIVQRLDNSPGLRLKSSRDAHSAIPVRRTPRAAGGTALTADVARARRN